MSVWEINRELDSGTKMHATWHRSPRVDSLPPLPFIRHLAATRPSVSIF